MPHWVDQIKKDVTMNTLPHFHGVKEECLRCTCRKTWR